MGFWSALGNIAGNYAKSKLLAKVGGDPNQGLGNAIYAGYRRQQQPPNLSLDQQIATAPAMPQNDAGVDLSAEPMGGGKIVTQPTLAIIGDKGPEKVQPLTPSSSNKVNATMLETQSLQPGAMVGQGGARARYRHVSGPNAIARQRPITGDLPLIPNKAAR